MKNPKVFLGLHRSAISLNFVHVASLYKVSILTPLARTIESLVILHPPFEKTSCTPISPSLLIESRFHANPGICYTPSIPFTLPLGNLILTLPWQTIFRWDLSPENIFPPSNSSYFENQKKHLNLSTTHLLMHMLSRLGQKHLHCIEKIFQSHNQWNPFYLSFCPPPCTPFEDDEVFRNSNISPWTLSWDLDLQWDLDFSYFSFLFPFSIVLLHKHVFILIINLITNKIHLGN